MGATTEARFAEGQRVADRHRRSGTVERTAGCGRSGCGNKTKHGGCVLVVWDRHVEAGTPERHGMYEAADMLRLEPEGRTDG